MLIMLPSKTKLTNLITSVKASRKAIKQLCSSVLNVDTKKKK